MRRASWPAASKRAGMGTKGLRLAWPASASTLPLPLPERGLARVWPRPWWAQKGLGSEPAWMTAPQRLPTSVALSKATLPGTPPMDSDTSLGPSQAHSGVSPQKAWEAPTSGWGELAAGHLPLVTAPLALWSASPRPARHSPGRHSSSGRPRRSRRSLSPAVSRPRALTQRWAVGYGPVWPASPLSLAKTLAAACPCLRHVSASSSSRLSMVALKGSSVGLDGPRPCGSLGGGSPTSRYLLAVGSETSRVLAI